MVSVILPTYNRLTIPPRALNSMLQQTLDDRELIIVDDGSIDDTPHDDGKVTPDALAVMSECAKRTGATAITCNCIDAATGEL